MFQRLCQTRHAWEVWFDFINMVAISIRSSVDLTFHDELEKQYLDISKKYSAQDIDQFAQLFAQLVLIIEENPWQDFLGEFYMEYSLNGEEKGQYFTPYSVAYCMAKMAFTKDHSANVYDCACGSGVMFIAAAEVWNKEKHKNYQKDLFFVGQDIDPLVTKMCYIQLSLLGCKGFITIGNSLTEPTIKNIKPSINVWPTPMFFLL